MATCLFTGQVLDANTVKEHTIPLKLAGRVMSRSVSSGEFNNRCSNPFDQSLIESYKPIMQALFPLLDAQHAPGQTALENPDDPGKYAIENGVFVLSKTKILACDIKTRKPIAYCGDPDDVKRMNRQLGRTDTDVTQTWVAPAETSGGFMWTSPFSPELEIAALKSALLTFDAVLEGDDRRFTRSAKLTDVREFVRSTIEKMECRGVDLRKFSLGIQYAKLDKIKKLRAGLPGKKSEFEHVLIASGHMAERSLDIVWLIAGTDPFGFRVSDNWDGGDFTCTVVNEMLKNEMLKGGGIYGPFWGSLPTSICEKTDYRSFPEVKPSDERVRQLVREISFHRARMCRQAAILADLRCDDYLIEMLMNYAVKDPACGHAMAKAVRGRLGATFALALEHELQRKTFERIVQRQIDAIPEAVRQSTVSVESDKERVDWKVWLRVYRDLLSELECEIGWYNVTPSSEISIEELPATVGLSK